MYRVLKYEDWINEALRATFILFSLYKKEKEMTECLVMLQLHTELSQRKASGFVRVHVYLFPCGLLEFQPHPQKSLKLMTSVSQADMYSIAKWILQVHQSENDNTYCCILSQCHSGYSYVTLCWSAMLRPAHISLTMRCHRSVSVFRLASKASFLPWTRSFRLGIRRSKKGADDTFTSLKEEKGG